MLDGATKSFVQAYNTQNVVDSAHQIILATKVTQEANDKQQLVPMTLAAAEKAGQSPTKLSADSGYFSERSVTDERLRGIDLYVAVDRQRHHSEDSKESITNASERPDSPTKESDERQETQAQLMKQKLESPQGKAEYAKRKYVVEPVHGQVKVVQAVRRFQFRGFRKVTSEWLLVAAGHNILKLFRHAHQKVLELVQPRLQSLSYQG